MLRIIDDEGSRAVLAAVVETAERALRLDSGCVQELASWTSPPGSTRRDGVPHTAYPARPERTYPHFPGRDFAHGRGGACRLWSSPSASRSAGCRLPADDHR